MAELRVDASQLAAADITAVTLVAEGATKDLVLNSSTNTFDGALFLTAGTHTVVARAFAGDMLVGASRSTAVEIQPGVVTRVQLMILDVTQQTSKYGPIIDSLTFPTTVEAGSSVDFAVSALAPDGSPLSYAWSSDCAESAFSSPAARATSWSKPTAATCLIRVTVSSNGFAVDRTFAIAVFPQGAASGAVDASGVFISAPVLSVSLPELQCNVISGDNASCANPIASPALTSITVTVLSWGGSAPGTLDVNQSCGGQFQFDTETDPVRGHWLPPVDGVDGGICFLTVHAVNSAGAVANLAPAILVRPGTPPTNPTVISAVFSGFSCSFNNTSSPQPVDCGLAPASHFIGLSGQFSGGNAIPSRAHFSDDCGGGDFDLGTNVGSFNIGWTTPNAPGRICTTTIRNTNVLQGDTTASARYQLQ